MIQVICDKCHKDCDLNAYVITVNVIHNPCPVHFLDARSDIKLTDDNTAIRMCLCQECYRKLGFPNIYTVTRKEVLEWRESEVK